MTGNASDPETNPLNLDNIRKTLNRLEDTIIFPLLPVLIERAQFAYNPRMYDPTGFADVLKQDNGFEGSWLMWFFKETESSHAKVRRYDSPEEYPFTPRELLPSPILPPLDYPPLLYSKSIYNANSRILKFYVEKVVPVVTKRVTQSLGKQNDDGNYGSAGTRDVECLQAISKRVHCGMLVSESKFLEAPSAFIPHILNPSPVELERLITKPAVEAALLKRLEKKAAWYGAELGPDGEPIPAMTKVDVQDVVRLYRDFVIPLTKDVEVEYLLKRLDGLSEDEIEELRKRA
ncbi:BZ3500_MvSof-1268-A1-R1_Chr10-4g03106 [Microbotryum saponariae]|uniref:chorismate mutase n=1 Tax=Microbotryum saponariae TaxID=289078 RepID=A0A2X0L3L9_9BASI|nr:BZ3501_MvSof-1269-A2-R1_Chr10-2g02681 [Microbotryum saponariae]SDA01154.1 BZ3500_MvSof-1268-A1-R1_Chr10-4g03106 [Microbotryum saponariae]